MTLYYNKLTDWGYPAKKGLDQDVHYRYRRKNWAALKESRTYTRLAFYFSFAVCCQNNTSVFRCVQHVKQGIQTWRFGAVQPLELVHPWHMLMCNTKILHPSFQSTCWRRRISRLSNRIKQVAIHKIKLLSRLVDLERGFAVCENETWQIGVFKLEIFKCNCGIGNIFVRVRW